jgi:hypothetical protein
MVKRAVKNVALHWSATTAHYEQRLRRRFSVFIVVRFQIGVMWAMTLPQETI